MSIALYTRYLDELYKNKGQAPMTLPSYGEGPALPDAEEAAPVPEQPVWEEETEEAAQEAAVEEPVEEIIEAPEVELAEDQTPVL